MDKPRKLTEEQKSLVELLKKGYNNKEISLKTGRPYFAIYRSLMSLERKYKIDTRERLVVFLLQQEFEERVDKIREIVYGKES